MKKLIILTAFIFASLTILAQDKKTPGDTTKIQLSDWQKKQINDLRLDIGKIEEQKRIVEAQLIQLYKAILDFQKVDAEKVTFLNVKDDKLLIVIKKP